VYDAFPRRISHTNVVDICYNEQHRGLRNGKKQNRRCLHCRFALGFFQKENDVVVQILSPSFPFEFSKPFQILDIVTCESRDIRLRENHVTYSPYSGEQARSNGLVRSTLLSRSRKGCCVVQRKIASRRLFSFNGISKGEGTRLSTLLGV
jgi:hypothetical protein